MPHYPYGAHAIDGSDQLVTLAVVLAHVTVELLCMLPKRDPVSMMLTPQFDPACLTPALSL